MSLFLPACFHFCRSFWLLSSKYSEPASNQIWRKFSARNCSTTLRSCNCPLQLNFSNFAQLTYHICNLWIQHVSCSKLCCFSMALGSWPHSSRRLWVPRYWILRSYRTPCSAFKCQFSWLAFSTIQYIMTRTSTQSSPISAPPLLNTVHSKRSWSTSSTHWWKTVSKYSHSRITSRS